MGGVHPGLARCRVFEIVAIGGGVESISLNETGDIFAIPDQDLLANHPALYMVDCIASLGCVEYRMDAWNVDVEEKARKAEEKREKRILDNWKKLVKGVLIFQKVQNKYGVEKQ